MQSQLPDVWRECSRTIRSSPRNAVQEHVQDGCEDDADEQMEGQKHGHDARQE